MSVELIDDLMEQLKSSHKEDFSDILTECMECGFIEDIDAADLFEIDISDLSDLMDDSSQLTKKQWNFYVNKLFRHLKKEKSSYDHLYYSDKK